MHAQKKACRFPASPLQSSGLLATCFVTALTHKAQMKQGISFCVPLRFFNSFGRVWIHLVDVHRQSCDLRTALILRRRAPATPDQPAASTTCICKQTLITRRLNDTRCTCEQVLITPANADHPSPQRRAPAIEQTLITCRLNNTHLRTLINIVAANTDHSSPQRHAPANPDQLVASTTHLRTNADLNSTHVRTR